MARKLAFFLLILPLFLTAQTTVTRSLASFERLGVSGGFDEVVLQQGNAEMIKITVTGIDPDRITTEVENGQLKIGTKRGTYGNFRARLVVTYRQLESIANSGSSDIVAKNVLKAENFKLACSGSGDFTGELDVAKLDVAISGSSDMHLKGIADEQHIAISGSGDVNANQLRGKTAEIAISGSGDVDINVSGKVRSRVSGSGNVTNN
jgi:hypothetical protein